MRIEAYWVGALAALAVAGCGKRAPLDSGADAGGASGTAGGAGGMAAARPGRPAALVGSAAVRVPAEGAAVARAGRSAPGAGPAVASQGPAVARVGSVVGREATAGGAPPAVCSAWTGDLAAQNENAIAQHGFFESRAILEGTLGDRFDESGSSWARFHDRKGAGRRHVVRGTRDRDRDGTGPARGVRRGRLRARRADQHIRQPAGHGLGADVEQPHRDGEEGQVALPEDVLGYRAWHAPNVLVLRVTELTEWGFVFEIVETVAGSVPTTFNALSWPSTRGPPPVRVGDERLAGISATGSELIELRPNNAEERARALRGIAALAPGGFVPALPRRAGCGARRRGQLPVRLDVRSRPIGCSASRSPAWPASAARTRAASSSPTRSPTCSGATRPSARSTGGHGVYNDEHCGNRFLYALRSVGTLTAATLRQLLLHQAPRHLPGCGVAGRCPPARHARESRRRQPVAAERAAAAAPVSPRRRRARRRVHAATRARAVVCPRSRVDGRPGAAPARPVDHRRRATATRRRLRRPGAHAALRRELAALTNRDATLYVPCATRACWRSDGAGRCGHGHRALVRRGDV